MEKINLIEILKDCPKGTKLYSTIFGEVEFECIKTDFGHQYVIIKLKDLLLERINFNGKLYNSYDGECIIFPSKDQRDWTKFKCSKPKFDINTLKPFDKILVRDIKSSEWTCNMFSHYKPNYTFPIICGFSMFKYCVPYNEETKHLVGTTKEAPKFYRYWED